MPIPIAFHASGGRAASRRHGGTTSITAPFNKTFLCSTAYYVTIDSTLIRDAASNAFAGISNKTAWDFASDADNSVPDQ